MSPRDVGRGDYGMSVRISVFIGDLADVPADALCTSTNPRLSLVMGTGASVRSRGGFAIKRACEAIVEAGKGEIPAGSVHVTPPGSLPCKVILHCVASDSAHRSSAGIIRSCVTNALERAGAFGCRSIAFPVLATGHAHFDFSKALDVMLEAIRHSATRLQHIFVVLSDRTRESDAHVAVRRYFPDANIEIVISQHDSEPASSWFGEED